MSKKDWFPFKGLTLEIRFRGTPDKWTRGRVVSWNPPQSRRFQFQFLRDDRKRPMIYLQEEIEEMKLITRRPMPIPRPGKGVTP